MQYQILQIFQNVQTDTGREIAWRLYIIHPSVHFVAR